MSHPTASQPSPVREWQISSARLTLLQTPGRPVALKWEDLFDEEPPNRNAQGPVITEFGPFETVQLVVQTRPGRADLVLTPGPAGAAMEIPTLGRFPGSTELFNKRIVEWAEKFPPVLRLAFGAQLFMPASSVEEANSLLEEIIGIPGLKLEHVRDFLLQTNVPRESTAEAGGRINRLTKLLAQQLRTFDITNSGVQLGAVAMAAGMELDISTSEERVQDMPAQLVRPLLEELLNTAADLAAAGPNL